MNATAPRPLRTFDSLYIDGRWTPSTHDDGPVVVMDSTTAQPFLSVASASPADVAQAVGAARRALDEGEWARLRPVERAGFIRGLADGISDRAEEMADVWVRQSGILYRHALPGVRMAAELYRYYADLAESFRFEEVRSPVGGGFGLVLHEPVGVVGAIVPWNGPTRLTALKVAPALAAGCTVVLKAPREAPGEAFILAEIAESIGLPAGVLNVIITQQGAAESLVRDPRVDKIAFTGSTETGRRIAGIMAERIGRVTLELGGKSPAVILGDYDISRAADAIAGQEYYNGGQVCTSLTRVLIDRRRAPELVDALAERFERVRVGDPFNDESEMGPLASAGQVERVRRFVKIGVDGGARLVTGGGRAAGTGEGYYVEPTLFADVDNASDLAQQEVFGPVISVIATDDEGHALNLANDTIYGLNAAVFTEDPDRALFVARKLRSGMVGQNGAMTGFEMGFGGMKQSGLGREGGPDAINSYLESKAVAMASAPGRYGA